MTPLKHTALAALLACSCLTASALDLRQAYQGALEQDAIIQAARANAAAGREVVPQTRAQLLPNVSLSMSRTRNDLLSTTTDFLGREVTTQNGYPSYNDTLNIRQPLYRKYQWAHYQQAQAQVEDVNAVLDVELQNLAVRVAGVYFEALLAQDQLNLVQTQRVAYGTQLDASRKLLAAGSGTRTDIDEAQARLDMNTALELEARQHVDYTRRQLQVMVNQPFDGLAALDADKLPLVPPQGAGLEDWVERAEQRSPELKSLRARLEVARLEVDKASAGHHPTLDAVAQLSRSGSENTQNISSSYRNKSIGLQLNVPLYAGGAVNSAVRQALANQERAEQLLEAGRRDLGVRVSKEYRGVTEGVLRVKALMQAVASAEQVLVSNQKSFQAGSRTRVDILNAENNKMLAQRDLAQARYVYLLASLRLKALVEDANLESIEAINSSLKP